MNQDKRTIKISDVVQNQLPEFVVSENSNFVEFLKQYYISQEYQGAAVDIAENLIEYKNVDIFNSNNLVESTITTSSAFLFDDVIYVESTNGWPKSYGLLKIDDEIITYTGITTNSFTGCIRGFSGVEALKENNSQNLVFSSSSADDHTSNSTVHNLSNLFLREFFKKIKYQFAPGFEEVNFNENINIQNFVSKVKTFYQTKGTEECFNILFKVLFGEEVQVVNPQDFCFTTSDDKWIVTQSFVAELISGDPTLISGSTLYQDANSSGTIQDASGSVYNVSKFSLDGKTFYKIHLFSGYSNNLNPVGSIFGKFESTPKTYAVENISIDDTKITVDSTIGFESAGILYIGEQIISYTDKTVNQFLNCTGIFEDILPGSEIFGSNYVYSYEDGDDTRVVKFRLFDTLSSLEETSAEYSLRGDPFKVENLGDTSNNPFTKSLIYNLPLTVFCGKVYETLPSYKKEGIDVSAGFIKTKYDHKFLNNDVVDLYSYHTNDIIKENVTISVSPEVTTIFSLSTDGLENYIGQSIVAKRKIIKSKSLSYPEINNEFASNVQNSYSDDDFNYVTSNGLPNYFITPYKRQNQFSISTSDYETLIGEHNFNTGESISVIDFTTSGEFKNNIGISTGLSYYVRVLDNTQIKLAYTTQDLIESRFINFKELVNPPINNNLAGFLSSIDVIIKSLYNKEFTTSKTLSKIPKHPQFSEEKIETLPGKIGILVNGIEIQNYKSNDILNYGRIKSINILNPGVDYDLLEPPSFSVDFGNDTETILIPEMEGTLIGTEILDPGFDYVESPIVTILNGSTKAVSTSVKLKQSPVEISFNASALGQVINTSNETFNFTSPHRLKTGEPVIYFNEGNTSIGIGTDEFLKSSEKYYIINVGAGTSFKLANTKEESLSGIGISIRSFGSGLQKFVSIEKRNVVDSVNIENKDNIFKIKKLLAFQKNFNHYDNTIEIENHQFNQDDEIVYVSLQEPAVTGFSTTAYYYVHKVDDNTFKLKTSKTSETFLDFGQADPQTVNLFEYSPIRVSIKGRITTSGISTLGYDAEILPVITGKVTNVLVQRSKFGYGSKTILNSKNVPSIRAITGSGAYLQPVILGGKITNVIIKDRGENYFNSVELIVRGSGYGAKLIPIIENGEIVDVAIKSSGIGYDQNTTTVEIVSKGKDLKVSANLEKWRVNDIQKLKLSNIEQGVLYPSLKTSYFSVYHLTNDLLNLFDIENLSSGNSPTKHSKIIGWAYDGCPIYGPDGFENVNGTGNLKRLKSSYKKVTSTDIIDFDIIENYVFEDGFGDLDEHNGRFCVTPEYPNGVYAYFCTVTNQGLPVFPYFIGNTYNYIPEKKNFDPKFNQDLNLNNLGIIKHTLPYGIENKENYYQYFDFFGKNYKNDLVVEESSKGNILKLEVLSGGSGYKLRDKVIFNNENTSGSGALAEISQLNGVGISSINSTSTSINNVTFVNKNNVIVGVCSTAHNIEDDFYINISGISTSEFSALEGYRKVNVRNVVSQLSENLPNQSVTGIVTSIKIKSSISLFEIDSEISIGSSETAKVIGLDYLNNSINILRSSGALSSSVGEEVSLVQKEFEFNNTFGFNLPNKNHSYYFNPSYSVSVGVSTLVGAGNTLTIPAIGAGISQTKYVSTAGIYLPNHTFKTGDRIKYTPGTGSLSIVTNSGNLSSISTIFAVSLEKDVIGITTQITDAISKTNLLYFTAVYNNYTHKIETINPTVTGSILSNTSTIYTKDNHNLEINDEVSIKVVSGINTTYNVTYDSINGKLKINNQNNPHLYLYKNSTVNFDISGISTVASFNLYVDSNFENQYYNYTKNNDIVTIAISDNTPSILYYNAKTDEYDLFIDKSVENYNKITIQDSLYNKKCSVIGITSTSFNVNYPYSLEQLQYDEETSTLNYFVDKSSLSSSISKVKLLSSGENYDRLPSIKNIEGNGIGASLLPIGNNIGKIKNSKVINEEFIVPSDKTLKPFTNLYSTLFLTNNYKVDSVNVVYGGSKYLTPPKVILYNTILNSQITNFNAYVNLKDTFVEEVLVSNPGYGILSDGNTLVFVENSNGIKILGVSFIGNLVTLTLETPIDGFLSSNPIPFEVGDEIFVEGLNFIGKGVNSKDYNYRTFTLTEVNGAYGSQDAATIKYYVDEQPGIFIEDLSINAYAINKKDLPEVELIISENSFFSGESVDSTKIIDNYKNSPINYVAKVESSDSVSVGDLIVGNISGSKAKISKIETYSSKLKTDIGLSMIHGWKTLKGNLSSTLQKLPDNDYYQNFSYSLKSKQPNENWESKVSEICHIAGYKKFGDLVVESSSSGISSITSVDGSVVNISLSSYGDVSTINDIDLVTENVDDYNFEFSDKINFSTKKLTDYILSIENRVLSIDDISSLFDNNVPTSVDIPVDTLVFSEDGITNKYTFLVQASQSFFGPLVYPMIFELFLTRNNSNINLTSYSYFENEKLGKIKAKVNPDSNDVLDVFFTPFEPSRSYLIRAIRDDVSTQIGITTNTYGIAKDVGITTYYAQEAIPTTKQIYSIPITECVSGTFYVGISSTKYSIQTYYEIAFLYDNNTINSNLYSQNVISGIGTVFVDSDGTDITLNYDGVSGIGVTVYTKLMMLTNTFEPENLIIDQFSRLNSDEVTFSGDSQVAISTISSDYGASRYIIEVSKTVGINTSKHLVILNSIHYNEQDYLNNINYSILGSQEELEFQTVFDQINNEYELIYTPTENADYNIKFVSKSILRVISQD